MALSGHNFIKNHQRLAFMRQESLRVAGPSQELFDYIREHRLDLDVVCAHAGYLNVALVSFRGDTFLFDVDGSPSAVIEALLFDQHREEYTADLVAWPLNAPDRFVTAMGANDGADLLGPQWAVQRGGQPLRVFRTPLGWLKAGCDGCVPLKAGARPWLVKAGGPYICDDPEHGHEIRDLLGSGARFFKILAPRRDERAA